MSLKLHLSSLFILLLLNISVQAQYTTENYPVYSDAEITQRLNTLPRACVTPRLTSAVKSYIRTYTITKRQHSEEIIGRSIMYFPIFEEQLKKHGLPDDIKYLAVVESALKPHALSRAGAKGLWQFMPATGREYGLRIDSYVDERSDPYKSSEAAALFLKKLYETYGNWELALAAYNCGPGRVNKAIRRSKSKDFWKCYRYLPRETRNYVPAFIGACYMMHYYTSHGIEPILPEFDLQMTSTTKVFNYLTFNDIQAITGTPYQTIKTLNPSYKRDVIPSSSTGNFLILPKHNMALLLKSQIKTDAPENQSVPMIDIGEGILKTVKTNYTVRSGDDISFVCNVFGCSPQHVIVWNKLSSSYLPVGKTLTIYEQVIIQPAKEGSSKTYLAPNRAEKVQRSVLALKPISTNNEITKLKTSYKEVITGLGQESPKTKSFSKHKIHIVVIGESLASIATTYGESLEDLMLINGLDENSNLLPGTVLKIPIGK